MVKCLQLALECDRGNRGVFPGRTGLPWLSAQDAANATLFGLPGRGYWSVSRLASIPESCEPWFHRLQAGLKISVAAQRLKAKSHATRRNNPRAFFPERPAGYEGLQAELTAFALSVAHHSLDVVLISIGDRRIYAH